MRRLDILDLMNMVANEKQNWLFGGSGGWKDVGHSEDVEFRVPRETQV